MYIHAMLRSRLLSIRNVRQIRRTRSRRNVICSHSHTACACNTAIRTDCDSARNSLRVVYPLSLFNHTSSHHCCVERLTSIRPFSSLTETDVRKRVEEITDLFFEARELLDDARSSVDTIYFNEDMQDAKVAVQEAIRHYEDLLTQLSGAQRETVVTAIGLKMEELRAQLIAITEEIDDDN